MFLGYQNGKITFVAETKEELENLKFVSFDKIEETDKTYFLHNGEYVFEVQPMTIEEYQTYLDATDWYVVRFAETGVEIPEEVKQRRQEAREKISELRENQA